MTDFQRDESAAWAQAVNKTTTELAEKVGTALESNAARGFPAPTGATLQEILQANMKAQTALVEVNGKIYADQRGRIFELDEFEQKIILAVFKMVVEAYKARILNQLAIEKAEFEAVQDKNRADIQRLNAQTEARQAAVIRLKADIEHQINIYKQQLIDAEYITLDAELALVNAKLLTAEKKLEIIEAIYQTIAAEELVQAAERRKADALLLVLEAEERIAVVKKTMIPMQLEKAGAREKLAEATTREAEVREEIERLGYRRLELKEAQEDADHDIRLVEIDFENAKEAYIRASQATDLARNQARRVLQEYANQVTEELQALEAELKKQGISFRLDSAYLRRKMEHEAFLETNDYEMGIIKDHLLAQLINMAAVAIDNCKTTRDGATQIYRTASWTIRSQRITKGLTSIYDPGGSAEIGTGACAEPNE